MQLREALGLVGGVVGLATVARADVEVAIGAEHEVAAVVQRLGVRNESLAGRPLEVETGRRVSDERIGRAIEPRDDGIAGRVDEGDEEPVRLGRPGRKRERQHPAFAAAANCATQVEKRGGQERAALNDPDRPPQLDDELDAGVRRILHERHRACQARDVDLAAKLRVGGRREKQKQTECGNRTFRRSHKMHEF